MKPETLRRSAPALVAVLVLALVAVVYVGVRVIGPGSSSAGAGSGGSGDVPVLRLTTYFPSDPQAAPDPRYLLSSPLSTTVPPAMDLRTVRAHGDLAARAARLAAAVGLAGSPDREGTTLVWSGDTIRLAVDPSGLWTLSSTMAYAGSGATTSSEGGTSGTAGGTSPAPVDVTESRRVAMALLDTVGVATDTAHETTQGGSVNLTVTPDLGGVPSVGLETTVSAMAGAVAYAQGWLATTEQGVAYPVISAAAAFDTLVRTPLPMPLMACPVQQSPAPDSVACGGPITVTAARLGLSLQESSEGPLLVPAWLFDVQGSEAALVQLAVPPRLLAPATLQDGSGGGTGSMSPGPDTPVSPEPGSSGAGQPPATDQPTDLPSDLPGGGPSDMPVDPPQSRFTSVTRGADDRSITVQFSGGVAGCYSYKVRAEERDDATVQLSLVETSDPAKVCIDLAVQITKTVALSAPLGVRRVVDAVSDVTLLGPTR